MQKNEIVPNMGKTVKVKLKSCDDLIDMKLVGYALRLINDEIYHQAECIDKAGSLYVVRLADVEVS